MSSKQITFGFSPCPNDTFIFNGLVNGAVTLAGYEIQEQLYDVETLNQMAFEDVLDVTKLSFFAWLMVKDRYRLLASGGALGYGCGPVVISRRRLGVDDMANCRIVLPGQWTTAHLLFRLWAPQAHERVFLPYDQIFSALDTGQADCGVIIHESRFVFEQAGFVPVVDLGAWWETQTGLPIPLGCIAAHERLPEALPGQLEAAICRSIALARQEPQAAMPYILAHSQEISPHVLQAHIHTFVNDFSLDLGPTGRAAVAALERKAQQAGIIT
jgi:1,4-dihydroxy-6-naphthoate synthase